MALNCSALKHSTFCSTPNHILVDVCSVFSSVQAYSFVIGQRIYPIMMYTHILDCTKFCLYARTITMTIKSHIVNTIVRNLKNAFCRVPASITVTSMLVDFKCIPIVNMMDRVVLDISTSTICQFHSFLRILYHVVNEGASFWLSITPCYSSCELQCSLSVTKDRIGKPCRDQPDLVWILHYHVTEVVGKANCASGLSVHLGCEQCQPYNADVFRTQEADHGSALFHADTNSR
mmetsp:Transcript_34681/g.103574  ORF Transcript_34681/g.103574 Transcript_34681/m.103574 type:complete len:233 (-) Transcript_34681:1395-2093(-)